jgi:hypothetical protein
MPYIHGRRVKNLGYMVLRTAGCTNQSENWESRSVFLFLVAENPESLQNATLRNYGCFFPLGLGFSGGGKRPGKSFEATM